MEMEIKYCTVHTPHTRKSTELSIKVEMIIIQD